MLVLLDVRFAFAWGLLAFAPNYIPNIGSVLAAIPPILQVLVFGGLYEALVAGRLPDRQPVFGNILEPRIMGRGLGLSTLVVVLSLTSGDGCWVRLAVMLLGAVDDYRQNCPRADHQRRQGEYRFLIKRCQ